VHYATVSHFDGHRGCGGKGALAAFNFCARGARKILKFLKLLDFLD
jgi:hypothetical protein